MKSAPVSLHPYFKVHPGQMEAAKALLPRFIAQTSCEEGVLIYEFTSSGDVVFCREAYVDAAATLHHLGNVDAILKEMLSLSDLIRLEIHGPATELDKMREPLKALPVEWFEYEQGLEVPFKLGRPADPSV